jgi:hypothetical protein
MGALKHIVLPLCTIAHVFAIGVFLVKGKEFMATMLDWPRDTVNLTPIERHLLGAGFTFHVVLTVNDAVAILLENAHYRAMATVLELILYSLDLADAMYENTFLVEGTKLFTLVPLASMTVVTLIGLVIHSMEPGVLTKDKNSKKKKGN